MTDLTPAMKQFMEIKGENSDSILFFRMGDFYEMFFVDAVLASRVLGIALTSRDKGREIPMCGIPFHAANSYIRKLVKEGHKVAVCEQVEEAGKVVGAGGIMRRAVSKVVTPGTALDEELLDSKKNNYIGAATCGEKGAGFAYMDLTTGEFLAADLGGAGELMDELKRVAPAELLIADSFGETFKKTGGDSGGPKESGAVPSISSELGGTKVTTLDDYEFNLATSSERLRKHFSLASLDGLGLTESKDDGASGGGEGVRAAGALLRYVGEMQRTPLDHILKCTPYYPGDYLVMDEATRRNLEVLEPLGRGPGATSLASLMDSTRTAMGGRRLKRWLSYPLVDREEINSRLDAVAELLERSEVVGEIAAALDDIRDLERLMGRVSLGAASPRDLVSLGSSLNVIPAIKAHLGAFNSSLLRSMAGSIDAVEEAAELIGRSISESPPARARDGGVIKDGYDAELDELRSMGDEGKDWIATLEVEERKRTGIQTLKVGFNKVFGYYITVTKANVSQVPDDYVRKQTLVNAERYITPELKEWEAKILGAAESGRELEAVLIKRVTGELTKMAGRVQGTAGLISVLDVLVSFAERAASSDYVRPVVDDGEAIIIEQGRHPVVEKTASEPFVPNDIRLDTKDDQIIILTGPNMAGKSTYIRQVALIVLMAQTGSFVPARSARIGAVDRIFTRVGASDDLSRGQSTFMVEMNEAANILNNATGKSLVILDEIGRGTSTFDGLSIAWAVAEYIHDSKSVGAKTLFATHYHELTELSLTKERVKNYNMAVKESDDRVVFLRQVVPGGASMSYGIEVARLAGMPGAVIERAHEILKNLERGELNEEGMPRIATRSASGTEDGAPQAAVSPGEPSLPCSTRDLLREEVEKLDTDATTPLEALGILVNLKKLLED